MRRWTERPKGSNWGDFGPDDQIGRMNLITPERRMAGVREVRDGVAFALSLPLDVPGGSDLVPFRKPPQLFAATMNDAATFNLSMGGHDVMSDDGVILYTQYSTQWDSLAHWGQMFDADGSGIARPTYYNGFTDRDVRSPESGRGPFAERLGIDHLAVTGVQGRGVLVDLCRCYGLGAQRIGYRQLIAAMDMQGVTVNPGDFLLIYTGFDRVLLDMDRKPDTERLHQTGCALDGSDDRLLQWITDSGIVAICSDNTAVEAVGRMDGCAHSHSMLPLHEHCLFKLGIHLGELWYLEELSTWLGRNGRTAFLLTAPPLRLPGSVGSPVTPVATV